MKGALFCGYLALQEESNLVPLRVTGFAELLHVLAGARTAIPAERKAVCVQRLSRALILFFLLQGIEDLFYFFEGFPIVDGDEEGRRVELLKARR